MKEIKIQIPEGYEGIDEEKSNLAEGKIVFKKKEIAPWREYTHLLTGYFVAPDGDIIQVDKTDRCFNDDINRNIFATKKQAESMLAMAQLSQIIKNDSRFGGPITDKEWKEDDTKYTIDRYDNTIITESWSSYYRFLAFHTKYQRDLFLEENEDLVKQYYMLD